MTTPNPTYQVHQKSTTSVRFINENQILSTSADGSAIIYDLNTKQISSKFIAQSGGINGCCIFQESIYIVGEDNCLWQIDERLQNLIKKKEISTKPYNLCINSGGKYIAVSSDNLIFLYEPKADKKIEVDPSIHSSTVTSLCFSNVLLQSSSLDGTLVRTNESKLTATLQTLKSPILFSDFPQWDTSITAYANGIIQLFKTSKVAQEWEGYLHGQRIIPIKPFNKELNKFISGSDNGNINIYAMGVSQSIYSQKVLNGPILAIDSCNDLIVIGGIDRNIAVLNKNSLNLN